YATLVSSVLSERLQAAEGQAAPLRGSYKSAASRTLLHVFPSFEIGGQQTRFATLARHFGSRYRHIVLSLSGRYEAESKLDAGVDYTRLPAIPAPKRFPLSLYQHRALLNRIKPDALVTYNWGSIEWVMAGRLTRVPQIHFEDGFGPEEARRQIARRVWTRRLALRGKVQTIVPSKTLMGLARDVWGLPDGGLHFVPNGIDVERFAGGADADYAARLHIPLDRPLIGTVTALRREKNLDRLIDAFAAVRPLVPSVLVIVGDGPEKARLEAMVAARGLGEHVIFTGRLDRPERLMGLFSLYALSSDTEQMPLGVLEAMAAGVPVAATDVGDVAHMVCEDNRPFLASSGSGSGSGAGAGGSTLAEAMLGLLREPGLARAIGLQNQAKARARYTEDRMVDTIGRILG
ncbi:MAG: glycosyltransferase family 4 protein, partial [Pseudomonadota bacterium]